MQEMHDLHADVAYCEGRFTILWQMCARRMLDLAAWPDAGYVLDLAAGPDASAGLAWCRKQRGSCITKL